MTLTLFIVYLVGFFVAIIFYMLAVVRYHNKIDLSDVGLSILVSLFSWLGVIILMIIDGDKFVIWKRKENG